MNSILAVMCMGGATGVRGALFLNAICASHQLERFAGESTKPSNSRTPVLRIGADSARPVASCASPAANRVQQGAAVAAAGEDGSQAWSSRASSFKLVWLCSRARG
jgi:hypothetical protein